MSNAAKFFIKLLLIGGIIIFALFNYRVLSIDKGVSLRSTDDTLSAVLNTATGVRKVEYYNNPFAKRDSPEKYNMYIVTNQEAYLISATQANLNMYQTVGSAHANYMPNKITPIPFWVEIIVGIIILIFPHRWKKQKKVE